MAVVARKGAKSLRHTKSLPDPAAKKAKEQDNESWTKVVVRHTFIEVPEPEEERRGHGRRASSAPPVVQPEKASEAAPSPEPPAPEKQEEDRTTVVVRGMPHAVTRAMLMQVLDTQGFSAAYDFLYLPIEFNKGTNFGYAFVNFVDSKQAERFIEQCQGFNDWGVEHDSGVNVVWSQLQNLDKHVERYRNSPVMHPNVADVCKPIVLQNGVRVKFPPPTQKVPALRRLRTERGTVKQLRWEENDQGAPCLNVAESKKRGAGKKKASGKKATPQRPSSKGECVRVPGEVPSEPSPTHSRTAMPMYASESAFRSAYSESIPLSEFAGGDASSSVSAHTPSFGGLFGDGSMDVGAMRSSGSQINSLPLRRFSGTFESVEGIFSRSPSACLGSATASYIAPGSSDTSYFGRRQFGGKTGAYVDADDLFVDPSATCTISESLGPCFLRTPTGSRSLTPQQVAAMAAVLSRGSPASASTLPTGGFGRQGPFGGPTQLDVDTSSPAFV